MSTGPISPPPVRVAGRFELPAYVSNGLVGLRIPDVPLLGGYALVNGFIGEHAEKKIEAAALAPFPLGGNLSINGVALSDAPYCVGDIEQAYDFASGELTTRFSFSAGGARAAVEVLTFCSHDEPSLVCQQVEVVVDQACSLSMSGGILTNVGGEKGGTGGKPQRVYKDLGTAAWHEDHVSLDIALAFVLHARITGDTGFLKSRAWPIVSGVATWLESRVTATSRGYEIRETMGIAERKMPVDNAAFMNMSAQCVLRAAIEIGAALGEPVEPIWHDIAENLVVPKRDEAIISYDAFGDDDEKAETPDPLMALFPLGCRMSPATERATLDLYLPKAQDYLGSPMLSAFYGVWAAWSGDRALADKMLEEGYAAFLHDRFMQTLEYRHDRFPEQPIAGPFFANAGAFFMGLLFGFPALMPDAGEPREWGRRPVNLPARWEAIEVERVSIRGTSARLTARHGAPKAVLEIEPAQHEGEGAT